MVWHFWMWLWLHVQTSWHPSWPLSFKLDLIGFFLEDLEGLSDKHTAPSHFSSSSLQCITPFCVFFYLFIFVLISVSWSSLPAPSVQRILLFSFCSPHFPSLHFCLALHLSLTLHFLSLSAVSLSVIPKCKVSTAIMSKHSSTVHRHSTSLSLFSLFSPRSFNSSSLTLVLCPNVFKSFKKPQAFALYLI